GRPAGLLVDPASARELRGHPAHVGCSGAQGGWYRGICPPRVSRCLGVVRCRPFAAGIPIPTKDARAMITSDRPTTPVFTPLPAKVALPAFEHEPLERWADTKVFERSLDASAGRPLWVFYEGPPTANGKPGTHHVEARVFKDLFPRYRTMKGYHVPRRAGW